MFAGMLILQRHRRLVDADGAGMHVRLAPMSTGRFGIGRLLRLALRFALVGARPGLSLTGSLLPRPGLGRQLRIVHNERVPCVQPGNQ